MHVDSEGAVNVTNLSLNGLLLLHNAVREALLLDDNTCKGPKPYMVRQTPDWRQWSDALEKELDRRNARFEKIHWDP